MNHIVHGLQGCVIYIGDAVIFNETWREHLVNMHALLETACSHQNYCKMTKSNFAHAYVTYLDHNIVGQGPVRPRDAKDKCIS